ncbi:enoyl-CoA hydratase/isomerase family protein [Rhizobium mesoamericanum]|uniref:3-hydroxyisobutyryl-CoA hydrolase n=1 Tax=Rhizobium mesoamericanum STM3625 TaxID=1211777 RepID=K0PWZ5_9HYPH|nr:enoyl-CoA hydratase/isomerase family protein [Rhizobium mesoamericanum]CCM74354.1 3-hydroxyisobutyryl-CoA hydrolase,mitochondrial [Rhizobium mesoamericanum STM3625]
MRDEVQHTEVIVERRASAGIIRLNRPRALNSLTLEMIRAFAAAMDDFAADTNIATVIVSGEGERGFCAGGDIRALHESGRSGTDLAMTFWREEFRLNHRIATFSKPYVALMDGITMGGGVGLSSHGRHRVVTERTKLAMPETGIGYFPDVGATWLLPRAPGEAGTWMGLTGLTIEAADIIHARLADHHIASFRQPDIADTLAELPRNAGPRDVEAVLKNLSSDPGTSVIKSNRDMIERCFHFGTVEEIIHALQMEPGEFAAETLRIIQTRSPTSLKLALRLLRQGRQSRNLAECLNRELGACQQILKSPDFYEGIRAAIIDKDRNPHWMPATLEAVDQAAIDAFFRPTQPPLAL